MEPIVIVQDYLDRLGQAVMAGDYASYRAGVLLPFTMVTANGTATIVTEADLRKGFDGFRAMLSDKQADQMIRVALRGDLFENGMVSGRYTTQIMAGTTRVIEPFQSGIVLRQDNGTWRAAWISTYLRDAHEKINLPPEWAGRRKSAIKTDDT